MITLIDLAPASPSEPTWGSDVPGQGLYGRHGLATCVAVIASRKPSVSYGK
jgi:hypothetical protein